MCSGNWPAIGAATIIASGGPLKAEFNCGEEAHSTTGGMGRKPPLQAAENPELEEIRPMSELAPDRLAMLAFV